ncbi:MAG: AAA family ATPase [Eubacterium sp.]
MQIAQVKEKADHICDNMEQVIVGKREQMKYVLAAFLAGGHVLLEDVPGTGKTMLSKSLAASFDMNFGRIQFTPDLLPSDVTGVNFFDPQKNQFEFRRGPVFTNILLADEMNRATPRTQSSLLECMEEHQVTVDGETILLEEPFFVIATQNPVEMAGTFPLPQAQLDRFMIQLSLGYPGEEAELDLLARFVKKGNGLGTLQAVCDSEAWMQMKQACEQVTVHKSILEYARNIAARTREEKKFALGVSTRGVIALLSMARSYAAICGEEFVTPDRIKELAPLVYAHRIISEDPLLAQHTAKDVLKDLIKAVEVPTEEVL